MEILTFITYDAARQLMDQWNALASVPTGGELSPIYINSTNDQWAINGTDCINNGGLGKAQIQSDVNAHTEKFTVETYQEFFDLGYTEV